MAAQSNNRTVIAVGAAALLGVGAYFYLRQTSRNDTGGSRDGGGGSGKTVEASTSDPPATDQDPESLRETANVMFRNGDFESAEETYQRAIDLDPLNEKLHSNRSLALLKTGRHVEALDEATRTIALNPDFFRGYQRKVQVLLAMGRKDEAVSVITNAMADIPELASNETLVKMLADLRPGDTTADSDAAPQKATTTTPAAPPLDPVSENPAATASPTTDEAETSPAAAAAPVAPAVVKKAPEEEATTKGAEAQQQQQQQQPSILFIEPGTYLMKRGPKMRFRVLIGADGSFEQRKIKENSDGTWAWDDDFLNPESEGSWKTDYGRLQLIGVAPKKFFLDFLAPDSKGQLYCINNLDEILVKQEIDVVAQKQQFAELGGDDGFDALDLAGDDDAFDGVDMGESDDDDSDDGASQQENEDEEAVSGGGGNGQQARGQDDEGDARIEGDRKVEKEDKNHDDDDSAIHTSWSLNGEDAGADHSSRRDTEHGWPSLRSVVDGPGAGKSHEPAAASLAATAAADLPSETTPTPEESASSSSATQTAVGSGATLEIEAGTYLMKRGPKMRFRVLIGADGSFEQRKIKENSDGTWAWDDDFLNPESEGSWKTDYGRLQLIGVAPKKFFLDFLAPDSKGQLYCINNLDEILVKQEIDVVAQKQQFAELGGDDGFDALDLAGDDDAFDGVDMGESDDDDSDEEDQNDSGAEGTKGEDDAVDEGDQGGGGGDGLQSSEEDGWAPTAAKTPLASAVETVFEDDFPPLMSAVPPPSIASTVGIGPLDQPVRSKLGVELEGEKKHTASAAASDHADNDDAQQSTTKMIQADEQYNSSNSDHKSDVDKADSAMKGGDGKKATTTNKKAAKETFASTYESEIAAVSDLTKVFSSNGGASGEDLDALAYSRQADTDGRLFAAVRFFVDDSIVGRYIGSKRATVTKMNLASSAAEYIVRTKQKCDGQSGAYVTVRGEPHGVADVLKRLASSPLRSLQEKRFDVAVANMPADSSAFENLAQTVPVDTIRQSSQSCRFFHFDGVSLGDLQSFLAAESTAA